MDERIRIDSSNEIELELDSSNEKIGWMNQVGIRHFQLEECWKIEDS